uniref:putative bifunctional diguanylate cyclase/phosphodiesterase n=1 Tax=Pararhizobium sp. IMCC3301 TaxID=3067904 RepID=UPI0027422CD5|nr:EAL domain-containing protein [Pararhizobium sp. IMCC3301]
MSSFDGTQLDILLVEDNPGDRRLAEIALREAATEGDMRIDIQSVGTLADCIARLADSANRFDAVLLDLGLPDATGLDGLRAARATLPEVPIIVLTGNSDITTATEALNFGACDYLDKAEVQSRPLLRAIRYAIERKKSEIALIHLARTDPLTGLLNRRAFFEEVERARRNARRTGLDCAVIMFDVDRFKEVNDLYGHKAGDTLLIAIADSLRAQLRDTDSIARVGGDEFAVLATHLNGADGAIDAAEKISTTVRAITTFGRTNLEATVSIGIAVFPTVDTDADADMLLTHADVAMYKSKATKRGSISFYDNDMDARVKVQHELKRRMSGDIAADRFFLHYQPIVDAKTHELIGVEALARWRDADGQFIPPVDFIPLAEESGLISQLSTQLLAQACANILRWQNAGLPAVGVSLNISPIECRSPTFALRLIAVIEKSGISPELINIELTESSIIQDIEMTKRNLDFLKTYGVGIHVDDFGTGYSSLSILKDLPLDVLKIDRSFVNDLDKEGGAEPIVQAVVELARKLNLKIVAEGVETEEQAAILASIGVDHLQGYYFSRPVDAEQLTTLWTRKLSDAAGESPQLIQSPSVEQKVAV